MNTLIITAHPSPAGFTHQIATAYQEKSVELGRNVEILDLYKSPRQDFFSFEPLDPAALEIQKMYQEKVRWADEVVFVHPMWWGLMPAIMKNWIDVNFTGGFSHTYKDGRSVGLLKGKKAKVFMTSDAPSIIYALLGKPYSTIWNLIILRFVGIKVDCVKLFGNKRKQTEAQNLAFLDKVKATVK
jgi:NAD(P)H dehydrogenase (quinone)